MMFLGGIGDTMADAMRYGYSRICCRSTNNVGQDNDNYAMLYAAGAIMLIKIASHFLSISELVIKGRLGQLSYHMIYNFTIQTTLISETNAAMSFIKIITMI